MSNVNDFFKDGVRQVTLTSWQEFSQTILTLQKGPGYVWRGQRQDWPLTSSFDRKVKVNGQDDRTNKLVAHLDRFKTRMNKTFPNVLPPHDIDIWALGQHYQLMSPLIDWSLSPYIAAYFAVAESPEPNDDSYRYVYGLSRSLRRLMTKQKKAAKLLSTDRSVPFIEQLLYPSPRFTAQQGIFTKAFQGNDIHKYVLSFSRKRPSKQLIVKIIIPTSERSDCLRQLHLMNIDHISLLLDLRGVVDDCNGETLA
jgi:hypothetical protein